MKKEIKITAIRHKAEETTKVGGSSGKILGPIKMNVKKNSNPPPIEEIPPPPIR